MSTSTTTPARACATKGKRIFTVQFHPEASPGPQDTEYLFDKFLEMVDEAKKDGAQNA